MSRYITEQMILRVHARCCLMLQKEVFHISSPSKIALRMEIGTFLAAVAWKVLLPLFVTVAGQFLISDVKKILLSDISPDEVKIEVMNTVSKELGTILPGQREGCIILIEEILKPLGIGREHAQRIFNRLIEEI